MMGSIRRPKNVQFTIDKHKQVESDVEFSLSYILMQIMTNQLFFVSF